MICLIYILKFAMFFKTGIYIYLYYLYLSVSFFDEKERIYMFHVYKRGVYIHIYLQSK